MNIDIMKTTDDNNVLNKINISTLGTVDATFIGDISILSPTLLIQYNSNFVSTNYAYISEYNRYYYVTNKEVTTGNRMKLYLTVDVLMSFKNAIKRSFINVLRNEKIGTTKIPDSKFPVLPNEERIEQTVAVNNNITPNGDKCYVLTVIGGRVYA